MNKLNHITYNEFIESYKPVMNEGSVLRIDPSEIDDVRKKAPTFFEKIAPYIWTEYDNNDIESGVNFVNRFAYLLTYERSPENCIIYVSFPIIEEYTND